MAGSALQHCGEKKEATCSTAGKAHLQCTLHRTASLDGLHEILRQCQPVVPSPALLGRPSFTRHANKLDSLKARQAGWSVAQGFAGKDPRFSTVHSTAADLHHVVEAIVKDEGVCHFYSVRLHGVVLPIVISGHICIIKIGHLHAGSQGVRQGMGRHCGASSRLQVQDMNH